MVLISWNLSLASRLSPNDPIMAFVRICLSTLAVSVLSRSSTATAFQQAILKSKNENGPFDAAFEKLVNETLELWHVPALSIGIVDGNDTWAEVGLHFVSSSGFL